MTDRRQFFQKLGLLGSTIALEQYFDMDSYSQILSDSDINWAKIRKQFPIKNYPFIHLNSGSSGVMPIQVQDALIAFMKDMNAQPPYVAWKKWQPIQANNKAGLARKLGVSAGELAIVRNTTEGLNTLVFGFPLKKGDAVIAAPHDYPFLLNALQQRVNRHGIQVTPISINLATATDAEIVAAYTNALTKNTKAVFLTHITHREGRIMPIQAISRAVRPAGVPVILDAAHSFAHIQYTMPDLEVDYMATSLHKWLNAPHGTGLLYIKKDKIPLIYPLPSANPSIIDTMDKFEHLGTRAFHQEIGISAALLFQNSIGIATKQARLHALKKYWTDAVKDIPAVEFCTPLDAKHSCAIASFRILGQKNILGQLKKNHNIHAKTVGTKYGTFVRITPNIFTLEHELDVLVEAIRKMTR